MTGTFALTFDTELIWGSFDHTSPSEFQRRYGDVRRATASILAILDRYEMPATWAIVGHLFLAECERDQRGMVHADVIHPRHSRRTEDWFAGDPGTDLRRDPLWYGTDIIDAILSARTPQEIGCHSFSHPSFDDPALTAEAARSDLAKCVQLAEERGIRLRSFVFPRNREGHHEALQEAGFVAFRGADPTWHRSWPGLAGRAAHLLDQAAAVPPPVGRPGERLPGLWNIPGSMFLISRAGARRLVPAMSRIRKANAGLLRAQASGGVFHAWTHPFNVASDPPYMLAVLEAVIAQACRARDAGQIATESMGQIADRMALARARVGNGHDGTKSVLDRSTDPGLVAPEPRRGEPSPIDWRGP